MSPISNSKKELKVAKGVSNLEKININVVYCTSHYAKQQKLISANNN